MGLAATVSFQITAAISRVGVAKAPGVGDPSGAGSTSAAGADWEANSNANVSLSEASSSSMTSRIDGGRSEGRFASICITSVPRTGGI